eukprot:14632895-Alexandrium_andersonii.AAC.1
MPLQANTSSQPESPCRPAALIAEDSREVRGLEPLRCGARVSRGGGGGRGRPISLRESIGKLLEALDAPRSIPVGTAQGRALPHQSGRGATVGWEQTCWVQQGPL